MKTFILSTFLIFFLSSALAQNEGKISGTITQNNKPAENATIKLVRDKDSSAVKLSVSDKAGQFAFDKLAVGKYRVVVTAIGHQRAISGVLELSPDQPALSLPAINLVPSPKDLADVTVTSKRPLIEQRIDRTIVNVDASITNVGTSALEVLEKSPGISVDRDGNVSLKGKQGVLIMVDGRPTHLSGADLANLLRNMSSASLDQIEIMTNPPARYDASGTAGVINIKTKKIITAGFNGSASIAYTQGRYPKTNEGFNFNYRNAKINLYTNLSHNYQKRYSTLNIDRNIYNSSSDEIENIFSEKAKRLINANAYTAIAGVDFFASKQTTFGAVVNLNSRNMLSKNPGVTNIFSAEHELQSATEALVNTSGDWNSIGTNLNFRRLIGKKGKELTADIDFLNYRTTSDLFMVNSYRDASGNEMANADTLVGDLPQTIRVYSGRADYSQPLKKGARFEAGIKSGIVKTDNNAAYDSILNGNKVHDFNRSNHFIYEENINAAYVNLSTPLSKKISAQFGLRLENTNAKGTQKSTAEQFDRHYTQLFPTAYFQYKANENNNFGANFGRRVRRPSYQSLNPFIRFIGKYTYSQGNPNLKPSVSNNIELSHTWKKQITTTLNYSHEKDIIEEIIQQKGQEAYNMPANVSSRKQIGLLVTANTPLNKWWTSNISINIFRDNYKGVINGAPINMTANSIFFNGTQQFKLNRTLTAEINGAFRNGWMEGVMRVRPIGFLGLGFSQQVLKGKGNLRLTARDILYTQKIRGTTKYGNVDFRMRQVAETQAVTIGFSYNFSKGKKIAPVKRTTGSVNEEKGRIGQ